MLLDRALRIQERRLGPEHPKMANTLNNLGNIYEDRGRYADAERVFSRSLAIAGTVFFVGRIDKHPLVPRQWFLPDSPSGWKSGERAKTN